LLPRPPPETLGPGIVHVPAPEVEVSIAPRDGAAEPHASETWEVATNGLSALFDRDGALVKPCDAAGYGAS
jgi:hypothetical protein